MKSGLTSDFILKNQTMVRFNVGGMESVAYSNTVDTPWVGPLLQFSKSVDNSVVSLNDTVSFSFSLRNEGNREASLVLYDLLPAGLSYIPNSVIKNSVPLPGADPSLGINLGSLKPSSTVHVVFKAIVVSIPPFLQFTNQGRADYKFESLEGRIVRGMIESNKTVLSVLPSSVAVIAEISTNQTFIGDTVLYQMIIHNHGKVPLTDLVAWIPLPSEVWFVEGSVVIGEVHYPAIHPSNGIPLGTLAPGASIRIRLGLRIGRVANNPFIVQGYIRCNMDGSEYTELANAVEVYVIQPQVSVIKQANKSLAIPGCSVIYQCQVRNENNFAIDAKLYDSLPRGLTLVPGSVRMNGDTMDDSRFSEGLFLGTLSPKQHIDVSYETLIQPIPVSSTPVTLDNQASVSYTFYMTDGRMVQQDTVSDRVSLEIVDAKFSVSAYLSYDLIEPGEALTFDVTLENAGSLSAEVMLIGWICEPNIFEAGNIIKEGQTCAVHESYTLGIVGPGEALSFQYIARVRQTVDSLVEEVNGFFLFRSYAKAGGCIHESEFKSELMTLILESEDDE